MSVKIVNLGLPKSGTTTLAVALGEAGFRVADWLAHAPDGSKIGFVGRLMYLGYYQFGDPLSYMSDFDAFTEISIVRRGRNFWPQTDWQIIDAIRRHHPEARFVFTWRDPEAHADSMRRWGNLGTTRLPQFHVPGLPQWHGHKPGELERWIEGHARFVRHVMAGAEDFLELDVGAEDAQARLAAFVGRDLPWWGVANANETRMADDADDGLDDSGQVTEVQA
ncbi:sulfotransferase [uncultured Maritimibacter sp.]|jgi:hypothetical protein|uniref:sulfotransferase n=1 Tax=uncultured Maritimibacter sp. TaxID=991866 RepID=UPI000A849F1D|nr:sulfotransferase [uncultured Maritimibacter sp.]